MADAVALVFVRACFVLRCSPETFARWLHMVARGFKRYVHDVSVLLSFHVSIRFSFLLLNRLK